MEDFELFPDEEEEVVAEEGANRTFIILVGALGGLLAVGICMFAVWAFVINPRMTADRVAQNQSIEATNTAVAQAAAAAAETPTEVAEPSAVPSDTPEPTPTMAPATVAPTEATPAGAATGPTAAATQAGATVEPTVNPNPTATRHPTATPKASKDEMPGTGIGTLGASALALGLLFLLIMVRRVRRAV
ncbi:MAG: hypothetical protein DRI77_02595 [Chloroflexi bacterium]|nr:MAG: hypothetical protein B6I34_03340 [Anaerolineaceae bacterium 4572_32.1]RLC99520.1 MAG: hypothetical protein DRI77_02595 [Chloroflexota bacterium]